MEADDPSRRRVALPYSDVRRPQMVIARAASYEQRASTFDGFPRVTGLRDIRFIPFLLPRTSLKPRVAYREIIARQQLASALPPLDRIDSGHDATSFEVWRDDCSPP